MANWTYVSTLKLRKATSFQHTSSNNIKEITAYFFDILRRVKTWLRTTYEEDCTCGLCMTRVQRNKVKENTLEITKSINDFASQPRRLQLLFSQKV